MKKDLLFVLMIAVSTFALKAQAAKIDVAEAYDNMQPQIRGVAKERVAAMDTNKDGVVTKKEYLASEIGVNNMRNNLKFEDFDTNNDGKFNEEDYYTTLSIKNYQLLVRIAKEEEAKATQADKTEGKADKPASKSKKK